MNQFKTKIYNYFKSCGWTVSLQSADSDGEFLLISNNQEIYLSYVADNNITLTKSQATDKMLLLQNNKLKTKTTILFANKFESTGHIEDFSTVFTDGDELTYLNKLKSINPNYKHIQLQAHNHVAFKSYLVNSSNKAAFVNATGTGKSYLIAKLSQHHYPKKVGILSSSDYILAQQKDLIGHTNNIDYMTYNMASIDVNNEHFTENLGLLILDEYHRAGAEIWGQGVQNIIDSNNDLELVGLSATNIRYLDNYRNMAEELFDGNIISSLPLTDAIAKGILPMPTYVSGIYDISETVKNYEEKINESQLPDGLKTDVFESLSGMAVNWDRLSNASTIISDNLINYNGKYIVFCENINHMKLMKEKVGQWIKEAHQKRFGFDLGYSINNYEMHSSKSKTDNTEALESFEGSAIKQGLSLLFTVDMLNEGKHVKDISGALLLRRTASPILFYQQIGRAFSASSESSPLIIDLVGNINSIHQNLFSEDLQDKVISENNRREIFNLNPVSVEGKIIGYSDNVIQKLSELDAALSPSFVAFEKNYDLLRSYYRENGHLSIKRKEVYNNENIGIIVGIIRNNFSNDKLTKDQVERLKSIDFLFSVKVNAFEQYYPALKSYHEENGHLNIKVKSVFKEGDIGKSVARLRSAFSFGRLSEEEVEKLKSIDFVFDASRNTFDDNYPFLEAYFQEHGHLKVKKTEVYQGKKLGGTVGTLRQYFRKGNLTDDHVQKLKDINFIFSAVPMSLIEKHYPSLKAFYDKYGHTDIKRTDVFENKKMGSPVSEIRQYYRKGKLTNDEIGLLEGIDFKFSAKRDIFEDNLPLLKSYFEEHGHLSIRFSDKYLGKNIGSIYGDMKQANKNNRFTKVQVDELKSMGFDFAIKRKSTKKIKSNEQNNVSPSNLVDAELCF